MDVVSLFLFFGDNWRLFTYMVTDIHTYPESLDRGFVNEYCVSFGVAVIIDLGWARCFRRGGHLRTYFG
jgi:hypothetical protein